MSPEAFDRLRAIEPHASYATAVLKVYGSLPEGQFFDDLQALTASASPQEVRVNLPLLYEALAAPEPDSRLISSLAYRAANELMAYRADARPPAAGSVSRQWDYQRKMFVYLDTDEPVYAPCEDEGCPHFGASHVCRDCTPKSPLAKSAKGTSL